MQTFPPLAILRSFHKDIVNQDHAICILNLRPNAFDRAWNGVLVCTHTALMDCHSFSTNKVLVSISELVLVSSNCITQSNADFNKHGNNKSNCGGLHKFCFWLWDFLTIHGKILQWHKNPWKYHCRQQLCVWLKIFFRGGQMINSLPNAPVCCPVPCVRYQETNWPG